MRTLEIKKYPYPTLRKKCEPVEIVTPKEVKLLEEMLSTMHAFRGIGLAASQVGIPRKLAVVDIGEGSLKLINPEIVEVKGKEEMKEGCLSLPGLEVSIARPFEVVVKALDEKGKLVEIKAKGLLARVLQHEIDHLKGKLIIDYMNLWKKVLFKTKLEKVK
jgi:peptide deformylase